MITFYNRFRELCGVYMNGNNASILPILDSSREAVVMVEMCAASFCNFNLVLFHIEFARSPTFTSFDLLKAPCTSICSHFECLAYMKTHLKLIIDTGMLNLNSCCYVYSRNCMQVTCNNYF